jgi:uncharacterized membrane protein
MIEAHVLDSWTRAADRQSWQFLWAMTLGGLGAPLFLFLAGVAVALSAGSKARRTGDVAAAAKAVAFRGLEIFALAFLFRIQAWVLGWSSPRALLKVDILNIMGPSIAAAAALWGMFRSPRARAAAFAAATLGIALATPIVRATPWLDGLPDPFEDYIRPISGWSNFCLFPWAGFLFAGAVVGVAIDEARTRDAEARLNARLFAAGVALAAAAYGASWLPSAYAHSEFWGGSPTFFLLRVGVVAATMGAAYAWVSRSAGWSPIQQLGRTSLFIYWIHVEMVYGLISLDIHRRLSHQAAWGALAAFCVFMLACSVARDRVALMVGRLPVIKTGDQETRRFILKTK